MKRINIRDIVAAAFSASDQAYLVRTLETRNPGQAALGSRFLNELTLDQVRDAGWGSYSHPDIQAPAQGFRAPIPGRLGIVRLAALDASQEVSLLDGHVSNDCPAGSGFVHAVVKGVEGPAVKHTTLLLGPASKEDQTLVVWTFFPGDPIMPSRLESKDRHGTKVTVADAIALGFEWAKIGS